MSESFSGGCKSCGYMLVAQVDLNKKGSVELVESKDIKYFIIKNDIYFVCPECSTRNIVTLDKKGKLRIDRMESPKRNKK